MILLWIIIIEAEMDIKVDRFKIYIKGRLNKIR